MKRKLQIAALMAISLLSACSGDRKDTETATTVNEKPRVKIALVTDRPVDQTQEYTATVEAEVTNNIAPSSPVRIENIYVEVGDRVAKGQKLVQMDAANLKQLKLQLDNQRAEFNRVDELYKVGGVSKSEWEASKMAMDVRETSYKNMLENTALLSPVQGIVTARNYDNGDMYSGAMPVLTVQQIIPVKLMINVSEIYFTQVKKGQPVKIKVDVYGDEEFEGTVNLVYPTINPATRTFPVEVRVANRDMKIRPGMFARVTLNFGTLRHVVAPDLAIEKQSGSGERYVFVYTEGRVYRRVVELGRRMGDEYELISGVENNSRVVIAGQSRLLDGIEVEVEQ
ncbi:MAG: efflux RND transporter periplasmic adaptor subunit [Tannerella sp.]|jgi:RND family efflux transporter MFP subunit|nr:efflux RND transporter periplasmic adaptor subunit [Tannerella sp.]